MSTAIEIRGLTRRFGPTLALDAVDLTIEPGEIHALVGENGAGKSTLMKILFGAERADAGSVILGGGRVAMVHQELSLCPHLTVEENLLLGDEPARLGFLRRRAGRERAQRALLRAAGSDTVLSPTARVSGLGPGDLQLVEIARALDRAGDSARLLILDEPTSSLGAADVARLFELVRGLARRGTSVLYVSHFLEEVRALCDRYTVLRDGRAVATGDPRSTSAADLVEQMVGRRVAELYPRSPRKAGEVVITARELAGTIKPVQAGFHLARGEVLGLAGVVGAGRTELLRAVFGLDRVRRGELSVKGVDGARSPHQRLQQGVGLLSEDRAREGIAGALSIADNLTLSKLAGLGPPGLVLPSRQRDVARRWMDRLGVRARDPSQPVRELSGGNMQKVALARLLHHGVDVLLLDEPTRGVDVGSKADIYRLVDELAAGGAAVLLVSSYLPELLGVADRIAVMNKGVLGPARPVAELDEPTLLAEVTGAA